MAAVPSAEYTCSNCLHCRCEPFRSACRWYLRCLDSIDPRPSLDVSSPRLTTSSFHEIGLTTVIYDSIVDRCWPGLSVQHCRWVEVRHHHKIGCSAKNRGCATADVVGAADTPQCHCDGVPIGASRADRGSNIRGLLRPVLRLRTPLGSLITRYSCRAPGPMTHPAYRPGKPIKSNLHRSTHKSRGQRLLVGNLVIERRERQQGSQSSPEAVRAGQASSYHAGGG